MHPSVENGSENAYRDLIAALVTKRGADAALPLEFDEAKFLDCLAQQGMTALVASQLDDDSFPKLSATSRTTLQRQLHNAVAEEMLRQREIARVLSTLARGGVESLLLKGAPLSCLIYSHPWLRPRCDTDIFIHAKDRSRTRELFEQCGYQAPAAVTGEVVSHQFSMLRRDDTGNSFHFDIHWKISNPQAFCNLLTLNEMTAQRLAVPEFGPDAQGPSLVHALLHALIHRIAHFAPADRMIWLYDIHLLGEALNDEQWREFIDAALAKRIGAVCLDGLNVATALFPSTRTERWAAGLKERIEPRQEAATAAFLKHEVNPLSVFRSDLSQLDWRGKWRLVREHLFPSAAYMRQRYRNDSRLALPFLYLRRIGLGVVKNLQRRRG